jgi:hypothetical protein
MNKYMNPWDILLIAFSAYLVIWGINALLRNVNMGVYQA